MREWRKLYKALSTSAKAAQVSDAALLLYVLALAHQDDAGRVPWNSPFARAVTAIREWPWSKLQALSQELCQSGLCSGDGNFLYITRGAELNGNPRPDKNLDMLYPEPVPIPPPDRPEPVLSPQRGEEKRGEERRREEKRTPVVPLKGDATPRAKAKTLSEGFIESMIATYAATWSPTAVRERIEEALNHVASTKVKNLDLYVRGWLRRDAEKLTSERSANGRTTTGAALDPLSPEEYLAAAREQAAARAR